MAILAGKTAVVTGAADAIGLAVARALLEDGAQVALVDADALRLDSLVRFLRGGVVAIPCDSSQAGAVRQAQQQAEKLLGPVDILVNAATASSEAKAESVADDEWRRVMGVNLDGAFFWARAVMPGMRKRGWGRIVNATSPAAKSGALAAGAVYCASMGAISALTFALARELAGSGVTVNAVAPAMVKTPMTDQLNEAQRRQLLAQIPVGRLCEPEELAHAVRFLVAPLSGFITGEVLDVNGGLVMD